MNIRRFEAPDIAEALAMIKAELGDEAVIIETNRRRRRDEATGLIENIVEVTAAIDFSPHTEAQVRIPPEKAPAKKILHGVAIHGGYGPNHPSPLLVIHDALAGLGLGHKLQQEIAAQFLHEVSSDKDITHELVHDWLKNMASRRIKIADAAKASTSRPRIAMIGPTGTGKTTTIAKLAALLKFQKNMHGVLVSVDAYRLGTAEQLARYARLMDIPFEALRDPKGLSGVLERYKHMDFMLIDTTGRGPSDPRHREELSAIFNADPSIKGYPVLCATSKADDLASQMALYSTFPIAGWVITKIDETSSYGPLCAVVIREQLPISYITNGQKVPEDIIEATKEILLDLLFANERKDPGVEMETGTAWARSLTNKQWALFA
ncbi:MAG: hypothetical protein ACPL2F_03760 [Dissulfurimicrobium hydrothermale]|uniref:flagellar biosynthesis protein FlhF n=1 Tax=Dissulfurimicrobium hydrothermale TaxID=1750598 RepID=UPI003C726173